MDNTISRNGEAERERLRLRQGELQAEVEELRKESKSKDLAIF